MATRRPTFEDQGPRTSGRQVDRIVAGLRGEEGCDHKHMIVTFSDGGTEEWEGSLLDSCEEARSWNLILMPTLDDSIRWERHRGAWHED